MERRRSPDSMNSGTYSVSIPNTDEYRSASTFALFSPRSAGVKFWRTRFFSSTISPSQMIKRTGRSSAYKSRYRCGAICPPVPPAPSMTIFTGRFSANFIPHPQAIRPGTSARPRNVRTAVPGVREADGRPCRSIPWGSCHPALRAPDLVQ